ncbi:MAG: PAS domain S-box protein [Hyphomicrobiales bacterium]|nr:MAG: PAS domain S-box protein [Hyphomicrobiales bacterium]
MVSLPGRVFPEFAAVDPAIREGLIVPFYDNGGVFIGTIWVVHTQDSKQFCANDVRIMDQLAVQLVLALKLVREQHDLRTIRAMLDDPDIVLDPTAAQTGSEWPHLAGWTDGREVRAEVAEFVEASAFRNSVLASSGDCMKVLDLDARVQFMNQGGIVLMEVSDPDSIIGVDWLKVWSGDEAALAQEAFHSARAGEAARFRGEAPTFAGTPRYWDVHLTPIRDQQGEIRHVLATSRDMTDHRRIEQQRELLAGELDHRVKNILAVVAAIAHQTFRPPIPMDKATEVFIRRISALGEAQSILTNSSWNSADIGVVVHGALDPLRSDVNRFLIDGPPLELAPSRALALALAIHELGTNATKYGALSQPGGMVSIQWTTSKTVDGDLLTFRWRESGGPRVMLPESRGFGSKLIERALAAEFRGTVRIDFEAAGVVCTLTAPIDSRSHVKD